MTECRNTGQTCSTALQCSDSPCPPAKKKINLGHWNHHTETIHHVTKWTKKQTERDPSQDNHKMWRLKTGNRTSVTERRQTDRKRVYSKGKTQVQPSSRENTLSERLMLQQRATYPTLRSHNVQRQWTSCIYPATLFRYTPPIKSMLKIFYALISSKWNIK